MCDMYNTQNNMYNKFKIRYSNFDLYKAIMKTELNILKLKLYRRIDKLSISLFKFVYALGMKSIRTILGIYIWMKAKCGYRKNV
jgi:hypothetical protein